jgi:hypothetical protein
MFCFSVRPFTKTKTGSLNSILPEGGIPERGKSDLDWEIGKDPLTANCFFLESPPKVFTGQDIQLGF